MDGCVLGSGLFTDQRGFTRRRDNDGNYIGVADIGAVEGVYNPAGPGVLTGMSVPRHGWSRFEFTHFKGYGPYTVFATTNVALPFSEWLNLGNYVVESPIGSGEFIFTDTQATNIPMRFYRVRSP